MILTQEGIRFTAIDNDEQISIPEQEEYKPKKGVYN